MYAGMAKTVLNYDEYYGKYTGDEYSTPKLFIENTVEEEQLKLTPEVPLHAASIWLTYQALQQVNRPESEAGWELFASSKNIAWKTGTSYGYRDAWAIGTTPEYVVGVWAGNADGEGRPGLTGTSSAAPVMFQVFQQLKSQPEFFTPWDELLQVEVCSVSGCKAGPYCQKTDTLLVYKAGEKSRICPYHQRVFIDKNNGQRITRDCALAEEIIPSDCFVLPPVQEWYYRKSHPHYTGMPSWKATCTPELEKEVMTFVYPPNHAEIALPRNTVGQKQPVVVQLTHRNPSTVVYWHLDDEFIGETKIVHQMAVSPLPGHHLLTAIDETGNRASVVFTVLK
jgi:penicillin-binding protein 1C